MKNLVRPGLYPEFSIFKPLLFEVSGDSCRLECALCLSIGAGEVMRHGIVHCFVVNELSIWELEHLCPTTIMCSDPMKGALVDMLSTDYPMGFVENERDSIETCLLSICEDDAWVWYALSIQDISISMKGQFEVFLLGTRHDTDPNWCCLVIGRRHRSY